MSAPDPVERAGRRVGSWIDVYTRGLTPAAARERRAEVLADVRDHAAWARESGIPEPRIGASILRRAVRGAIDDLTWALSAGRELRRPVPAFHRPLLALVGTVLLGMIAFATFSLGRGAAAGGGRESFSLVVGILIGVGALVLLARARTRWLGALWGVGLAQIVLFDGIDHLAATTTVLAAVADSSAGWRTGILLADAGIVTLCIAAALWWRLDPETPR